MNQKTPKISVVMPVYNTKEEYLREAIESILNQTYSDFEFIILNDGSTNNVEEIILSYKDERIKYVKHEKNLGLSSSRNELLDISVGEYIAYMDSDDMSTPDRFQIQVEYMEKNKDIDILGAYCENIPENTICKCVVKPKYMNVISEFCMGNYVAFLRKDKIQQYGLRYDNNFIVAEDGDFWSRAIRYMKFANIEKVLIKRRKHDNNISKTKADLYSEYDKKIQQNMLDFLTDDSKLQEIILRYLANEKAPTFVEKLFSVRRSKIRQYKIITILGLRFLIKGK